MVSNEKYTTERERMKKLNKIDGLIGAKDVGHIIDQENNFVKQAQEKDYSRNVQNMNEYFIKLFIDTMEQKYAGVKRPIYRPTSYLITT